MGVITEMLKRPLTLKDQQYSRTVHTFARIRRLSAKFMLCITINKRTDYPEKLIPANPSKSLLMVCLNRDHDPIHRSDLADL
jgi:hypothetical protein